MATVPDALGGKVIHPYSDFLLHDVGTGDGIAQTQHANLPSPDQKNLQKVPDELRTQEGIGGVEARTKRAIAEPSRRPTPASISGPPTRSGPHPLWGLRSRPQMMHDGLSPTIEDAIHRHPARPSVRLKYEHVQATTEAQLLAFLSSL